MAVPRPLAARGPPGFTFTRGQVESLAKREHDRWKADLLADGWVLGAVKDPNSRRHSKLVSWEQLTEDDREKDRSAVRAIPTVLARAGFEILVSPPAEPGA